MIWRRLPPRLPPWVRVHPASQKTYSSKPARSVEQYIRNSIKLSGPISVAEFMQQALLHPFGSYYGARAPSSSDKPRDILGAKGDFVTSPEISQLFGEMVGLWLAAQFRIRFGGGDAPPIQILEFGPGRGTLLADALRILRNFPDVAGRVKHVDLVESSPMLRQAQAAALGLDWTKVVSRDDGLVQEVGPGAWHSSGDAVPVRDNCWTFAVAHEFFDALPVHQFLFSDGQWRERLVATAPDDTTSLEGEQQPFAFVMAPKGVRTVAHRAMLDDAYYGAFLRADGPVEGAVLETSPAIGKSAAHLAAHVRAGPGGCGLVADYGKRNMHMQQSVRGIREHKVVHPLSQPGATDMTANVNFDHLAHSFASNGLEVFGPVTQRDFLREMGIEARLAQLQNSPGISPENQASLKEGCERLVDPTGMGASYQFLAVSANSPGSLAHGNPPGFSAAAHSGGPAGDAPPPGTAAPPAAGTGVP